MKKLLTKLGVIFFLGLSLASPILAHTAMAAETKSDTNLPDIPKPLTLPGPEAVDFSKDEGDDSDKRQVFITNLLPNYTVVLVGFVGVFAFLYLVIAGVRFVTAYGNDEAVTKAKNQATYALVAFLIALLAYTVVTVIVNIEFKGNKTEVSYLPKIFQTETAYAKKPDINELMPRDDKEDTTGDYAEKYISDETEAVATLPDVNTYNIVTTIVTTVLKLTMVLTVIAIVVAGIFYLISGGNEDQAKKAKNVILYLLIGMAIIAVSYGVVVGISQFKFLE